MSPTPARPSRFLRVSLGASLLVALAVLPGASGLRLNLSPSLPIGLYRLTAGPIERGTIVLVCLPPHLATLALERGYLLRGDCPAGAAPIGKQVVGLAGDTVELTRAGILLNGRLVRQSHIQLLDSRNRPLPQQPLTARVLGPDELWLFAPHPRSFDSRYFGPVSRQAVRARIAPLLTIGGEPSR